MRSSQLSPKTSLAAVLLLACLLQTAALSLIRPSVVTLSHTAMEASMPASIGIIGVGYVGSALLQAAKLHHPGVRVEVTTTSPDRVAELQTLADAVTLIPRTVQQSPEDAALRDFVARQEAVLVAVAPKTRGADSSVYRETYVGTARRVADALRVKQDSGTRVAWVSSTSVYGMYDGGESLNESMAPLQPNENQRTLKEAEDILFEVAKENPSVKITVLRLSGIWGPGRLPGSTVLRRHLPDAAVLPASSGQGTMNLVHLDDIVAACMAALGVEATPGPWPFGVLNVSGCSVRRRELYDAVAKKEGLPAPVWSEDAKAGEGAAAIERGGNKRIDSSRLLSTGFVFKRADVLRELEG